MEDLILEYRDGRRQLRESVKRLREIEKEMDDPADLIDVRSDISLLNGMIRDMTEAIGLMKSPHHRIRGDKNVITMDPHIMSSMNFKAETWEPSSEDQMRSQILEEFSILLERRIHLLTNKQRSTLDRWLRDEMSISEIALEDGVSRQAIHQRIFGNKSHDGALKKLREG